MKRKKKNQKKMNRKKVLLYFVGIIVLVFAGWMILAKPFGNNKKVQQTKVADKLEKYGYSINDNATTYCKDLFKNLKKTLNKDKVNEEEYAKLVSQLFLADYFTLDNKVSKNDVGGVQFVYHDYQESFTKLSTEQVYKYVESNIYGNRKQELPVVKNVEVTDIMNGEFEYQEEVDENAYIVELAIEYEKDLGYQSNATITLIHSNNKLEIAKMS